MSRQNADRQSSEQTNVHKSAEKTVQSEVMAPGHLLQRAQIDPTSLTSADVLHLQRTIGNRATGRLLAQQLSVQTKLQLGPANDQYEQEADAVARQVVRRLAAPPVQGQDELDEEIQAKPLAYDKSSYTVAQPAPARRAFVAPKVQRADELDEEIQAKPLDYDISSFAPTQPAPARRAFVAPKMQREEEVDEETAFAQASPFHGLAGGDVDAGVAQSIQRARGSGSALDPKTRYDMEGSFGADFGGVRVHTDAQSDRLNRSLNARAFTTGKDIFFRKGEYSPGSSGGKELLAHELTHTVQQGAAGVQRDALPAHTPISSAEAGVVQRDIGFEFETNNVLTMRSNTGPLPVGGFPDALAATAVQNAPNTTRVVKGAALLTQADVEVQADDRGANSDLEVVTTHFPLTVAGRTRLDNALADVTTLVNAHHALMPVGSDIVPAEALGGTANFATAMRDGMIGGNWSIATTAPQITIGTRIGNISDIVRDLHGDPTETLPEKGTRDPGRLRMRRPNALNPAEPRALNVLDDASTLVDGHTLAQNAIAAYQLIDGAAPGGAELEGLLTIIFTYCEGVQHKQAFLKQHTPLMAKTNLATIFTTLPGPVQTYYSIKIAGQSNLERVVATAPGYAARMNQPLFAGVGGVAEDNQALGQPQWYHRLTLESWLRGIVLRDRTKGEAFAQFFKDNWGGSTQRPGKDQLTTQAFPGRPRGQEIEGYGALGNRMDTDVTTGTALPVFELRAASRQITYAAAQQWALDLFDYVESLNANPGGGYAHIV